MQEAAISERMQYYQDVADLTTIFLVYDHLRLQRGEVVFAFNPTEDGLQEFDLEAILADGEVKGGCPVINFFTIGVQSARAHSWQEFQHINSEEISTDYDALTLSDYTNSLFRRIAENGPDSTKISFDHKFTAMELITRGLSTGVKVSAQLVALSKAAGNLDPAKASIALGKMDTSQFGNIFRNIGVGFGNEVPRFPSYDLLDKDGKYGINWGLLKRWGYPAEIGCPGGIPPSRECRDYIDSLPKPLGIGSVRATPIEATTTMIVQPFERYVMDVFNALGSDERRRLIRPDDVDMLEGKMPSPRYARRGVTRERLQK